MAVPPQIGDVALIPTSETFIIFLTPITSHHSYLAVITLSLREVSTIQLDAVTFYFLAIIYMKV